MDTFGHGGFVAAYLAADYVEFVFAADYSANPYWLSIIRVWMGTFRHCPND